MVRPIHSHVEGGIRRTCHNPDCKIGLENQPEVSLGIIEQRWLQIGLSTFFWAGVVNASFAAGGLWAIYQCNQIYEKALIVQHENVKAERELRDIVLKARSERLQLSTSLMKRCVGGEK